MVSNVKRILALPSTHQLGTTIPLLSTLEIIGKNRPDIDIHIAGSSKYSFIFKEYNYTPHYLLEIPNIIYRKYIDKENNYKFYSREVLELFVESERELISEIKPDLLLTHVRLPTYLTGKILGIPVASLVTLTLSNYYKGFYYFPETYPLYKLGNTIKRLIPSVDPTCYLPRKAIQIVLDYELRKNAKTFNQFLNEKGYNSSVNLFDLMAGDIPIFIEHPAILGKLANIRKLSTEKDDYFYLHPKYINPYTGSAKSAIKKRFSGLKTIYLNLGTSSMYIYLEVLSKLLAFLDTNSEWALITNHCQQADIGSFRNTYSKLLGKLRQRVQILPFVDPRVAIRQSDIIISHGGKSTLNEILLEEKPFIAIPNQVEQLWNIKEMEKLGVCITCLQKDIDKLPDLLLEILIAKASIKDRYKTLKAQYKTKIPNISKLISNL